MKKQFYSFLRGLVVGLFISLFYVLGGFGYVSNHVSNYLSEVNKNLTENVTELEETLHEDYVASVATSTTEDTGIEESSASTTVAEDELPEEIEALLRGFDSLFLEDVKALDRTALELWFSTTAPLEIISHPYSLNYNAEDFCANSDKALDDLHTRLNDRTGYAKDRHAEQVDQYSLLANSWAKQNLEASQRAQETFSLYSSSFSEVISYRLSKEKYETFLTQISSLNNDFSALDNGAVEQLSRNLRILRDERTSLVTEAIKTHRTKMQEALEKARISCNNENVNSIATFFQLQSELSSNRRDAQLAMNEYKESTPAITLFTNYDNNAKAAREQLVNLYRQYRESL